MESIIFNLIDDGDKDEDKLNEAEEINNLLAGCDGDDNEKGDDENKNQQEDYDEQFIHDEDYYTGATDIMQNSIQAATNDKNSGAPALSDWVEHRPEESDIVLTVAKARRRLWQKAKEEIGILKENLEDLRNNQKNPDKSDIYALYEFLFSTDSLLCETLCRYVTGFTKKDYLSFMVTFLMSCKSQTSVPILHYCQVTNSDELMPTKEYNHIWARLGAIGGSTRQEPLWMTIEEVANTSFKTLFLPGKDSNKKTFLLGIDDDKLHFNYRRSSQMRGLKYVHHVKDNKRGFTLHTAAYSALCVPICVMYQRELEGVQATYQRILKYVFGKESGEAVPDMKRVTLASDRGYWKPALIFSHALESGANVEGTVQRVSKNVFFCCSLYILLTLFFAE